MRIRCSKGGVPFISRNFRKEFYVLGLKINSFCGHFFIRSSDLLSLPATDPDKGYAIEVTHDETVIDGQHACIQCALLYTASSGERRIR